MGRSILARARSRKATVVDPAREAEGEGEFDDIVPLTPCSASAPGAAAGVRGRDLEVGEAGARKTRRTLFGIIEGWWDLGLLDRGRSLRRKG